MSQYQVLDTRRWIRPMTNQYLKILTKRVMTEYQDSNTRRWIRPMTKDQGRKFGMWRMRVQLIKQG